MAFILEELFAPVNEMLAASKNDVDIIKYPLIHSDDLEPVSIIQPTSTGPWIAGGAALRWYQNMPVGESDIDIFCANARQANEVAERIKSYGRYSKKFESENAITFSYHNKTGDMYWTLQIITRRYFNNLQEVIDNFDITVCQIGHSGQDLKLGKFTARDIRERNLRMQVPLQPDAAKRLIKYWVYGYRPVDGLIEAVQANPVARWQFGSETEDYENAF